MNINMYMNMKMEMKNNIKMDMDMVMDTGMDTECTMYCLCQYKCIHVYMVANIGTGMDARCIEMELAMDVEKVMRKKIRDCTID
jgi:hypothetical protein